MLTNQTTYTGPERRSRPVRAIVIPPTPPLDVMSWIIPQAGHFTKPVFVRVLPDGRTAVYYIKNKAGWPYDIKTVDSVGIYFRVTENDDKSTGKAIGWPPQPPGSPSAYRLYTPQFMIAPRYYDPTQGRVQVSVVTNLTTHRYPPLGATGPLDCSAFSLGQLGPAASFISLVPQVSFGGDVGVQDSLVSEYYYNQLRGGSMLWKTRERFFFTPMSGWVQWDVATSTDGIDFTVSKIDCPNKFLVPDPQLVPVQPCPIQL